MTIDISSNCYPSDYLDFDRVIFIYSSKYRVPQKSFSLFSRPRRALYGRGEVEWSSRKSERPTVLMIAKRSDKGKRREQGSKRAVATKRNS